MRLLRFWPLLALLVVTPLISPTAQDDAIETEALIERILAVEQQQRAQISDLILDTEFVEGELGDDGEFDEKIRLIKRVSILYHPDTTFFHTEYLEYYEYGELREPKDLEREAKDREEQARKRKAKNIAWPMLTPFYEEKRDDYSYSYLGVTDREIEGYTCYHIRVEANRKDDQLINGDFYFETDGFNLVRVDFSPAKLVKKAMFRLSELKLSIQFRPTPDGLWLPSQFDASGKGKAALFFGVEFASTERYRNPQINTGLTVDFFEVENE